MGDRDVRGVSDEAEGRRFTQALLRDVQALERLLDSGRVETGIRRLGVEQEMFLIDDHGRPAPVAEQVLARLDDWRFTTELARFNLEANLEPQELGGDCLAELERRLEEVVGRADDAARTLDARILLVGILPSLQLADLVLDNMSPVPRYLELNRAALRLRGGRDFVLFIRGVEQLEATFDSVMAEAANTSLQLHLQVDPETFVRDYNLAQLISAPLLAAASNSPLLCGRRLWHETRVAVFERAVDSRSEIETVRGSQPRVSFGYDWARGSVLDLFRENVTRYRVMLVRDVDEDPVATVESGEVPRLQALALHNGTIWRWNRPCYGTHRGQPHLRIENRVLPSGPSLLDEVANAALFYGLMTALPRVCGDPADHLPFAAVRNNFLNAARLGLDAHLAWLDGYPTDARSLLLDRLLPLAEEGLTSLGVSEQDRLRYLGTVEARVRSGMTGARWMLEMLRGREDRREAAHQVTLRMRELQDGGQPVHRWPLAIPGAEPPRTIGEIMSAGLYTVRPEDVIDLASAMMEWQGIRHVPVEDERGKILGILSPNSWPRLLSLGTAAGESSVAVEDVMDDPPPMLPPDTPIDEALARLLGGRHHCVLVMEQERAVGIVTERDFLTAWSREREATDRRS